jgi:hypothetical protein
MPRKGANHDSDAEDEPSGRKQSGKKAVKLRKVGIKATSQENAVFDLDASCCFSNSLTDLVLSLLLLLSA